ncbi:MAG: dTDP-4-dehydrorhamnose reductase [Flavobacteriaceae bacterium]|nr:dTDP-4-dehydrorhamnose reductase [Flavobacteriaceae bacterium]
MKNVLVCGAEGQLGSEIRALKKDYFYTQKSDLDITDKKAILDFVVQNKIQIIVNCAGYTQVDKAEDEPEICNKVNHLAVRNLAEICLDLGIYLIHISTDYVFDGMKNQPYKEDDTPNPKTVYGMTKLAGERAIQQQCERYLILRTSWLYSEYRTNFVKTIQRLSREKSTIKVVSDQIGSPTYAKDLAKFIIHFIEKEDWQKRRGIYHFSNKGEISWYEFAKEIVRLSKNKCEVTPCSSEEYPTKAFRPQYTVLDTSKFEKDFDYSLSDWKESLFELRIFLEVRG